MITCHDHIVAATIERQEGTAGSGPVEVAVVYCSATDNIARIAREAAGTAEKAGGSAGVRGRARRVRVRPAGRPLWTDGSGYHALTIRALTGEVVYRATWRTPREAYG